MNILITGGSGFIGTHLAQRLALEHAVTIYDRRPPTLPPANAKVVIADLHDDKALRKALRAIEIVIHLAATVSVTECEEHPLESFRNNVSGTARLLEACAQAKVGKVIFASSAAVYGDTNKPSAESDPLAPVNAYGRHKMACEQLVQNSGIASIILRLFNVYGPGQIYPQSKALLPRLAHCIQTRSTFTLHGDGQTVRDFVHIKDVTRLIESIALMKISGTYNIGTGYGRPINWIINRHLPHVLAKGEPRNEAPQSLADTQKLWTLQLCTSIWPEHGIAHYLDTY